MIIVTGGAGFIGSMFLEKINNEGIEDIIVVDKLRNGEKWKNLVGKKFIDFVDKEEFLHLLENGKFKKIEAIVHIGACSSTTEKDADYLMKNNFLYSRDLAKWSLKNEVRFIYASSAAVYGDGSNGYADEAPSNYQPLNMYGFSKLLMDEWVLKNNLQNRVAGFRFFNVFGPNEYHKKDMRSVVLKAFQQITESGKAKLFKSHNSQFADGKQMRDFVYVKDVVEIMFWFLQNPVKNGIFNIGTGEARTFDDLVKAVFVAMKKPENIEYIEMPPALRGKYQYFTQAEIGKLISVDCPAKFTNLEDAIADYVQNYLSKLEK